MSRVLKVDDRDLSAYLQVEHEAGLDPANPEYSEPQFSGSAAFSEGKKFVGDAVDNRLMSFPLILKADTVDALYQLVRDINNDLEQGARVEFRSETATSSTFLDLEAGRLEPKFEWWLDNGARVRAMLHLWCQPYGHTGTARLVASIAGASAGAFHFPATGILGDKNAQAVLKVRAVEAPGADSYLTAFGIHRSASFKPDYNPVSASPMVNATVFGDARALGSQGVQLIMAPTAVIYEPALRFWFANPRTVEGRNRAFILARSRLSVASALQLSLWAGKPSDEPGFLSTYAPGPGEAIATVNTASAWQLVDLGEVNVPRTTADQEPLGTYVLNIYARGASGASAVATYPFHFGGLILLPLDESAGMVVQPQGPVAASQFVSVRSLPKTRAVLHGGDSTPSSFTRDLAAYIRGEGPKIPPVGSPGASGPARIVVMTGQIDNYRANDKTDVILEVRERFSYLR